MPRSNKNAAAGRLYVGFPSIEGSGQAMLVRADAGRKRIQIVTNVSRPWRGEGPDPEGWNSVPRIGPWQDCGDTLMRFVYVPNEWVKPGGDIPKCPDCGTLFKETNRYDNMIDYEADCIEKHHPR
jgi:hypothetical protein